MFIINDVVISYVILLNCFLFIFISFIY